MLLWLHVNVPGLLVGGGRHSDRSDGERLQPQGGAAAQRRGVWRGESDETVAPRDPDDPRSSHLVRYSLPLASFRSWTDEALATLPPSTEPEW